MHKHLHKQHILMLRELDLLVPLLRHDLRKLLHFQNRQESLNQHDSVLLWRPRLLRCLDRPESTRLRQIFHRLKVHLQFDCRLEVLLLSECMKFQIEFSI